MSLSISLRTILERLPVGFILFEMPTKRILDSNLYISQLLDYDAKELFNHPVDDLFESFPSLQENDFSGNVTLLEKEIRGLKKGGSYVELDILGTTEVIGDRLCMFLFVRDISKLKKVEKSRQEQLLLIQRLGQTIPSPIFFKDNNYIYRNCNEAFEKFIGLSKQEIIGYTVYDLFTKELADIYYNKDIELLEKPGIQVYEAPVKHADGTLRQVVFNKATYLDTQGEVAGLIGVMLDVTERKSVEEELRRSEEKFRAIFEKAAIGIVLANTEGKLLECNPAMQQMLGYCNEELRQMTFMEITHPEDIEKDLELFYGMLNGKYNSFEMEKRYIRKDGQVIWARLIVSLIRCQDGKPHFVLGKIENITRRKQSEEQLAYLATHDFLTKIPNRYMLEKHLKSIKEKAHYGQKSAVLLIGVDNFKLTNDTLGHMAGDQILKILVALIQTKLRQEDFVARLWGDEFVVVLEGVTSEEARIVAEQLCTTVEKEEMCFLQSRSCLNITISIGVIEVDGTLGIQNLLALADIALHSAKERGKNRVVVLSPNAESVSSLSRTNQVVNLIRSGLRENRFVLFFQPVINQEGGITHHEVLLRLKDDEGNLLSPGVFIPVAEQFGLMAQVDRWVVQHAIKALQKYDIKLFVNLSGVSLGDAEQLQLIQEEIIDSGIDASHLGFEITETVAVKDFVRVERWIDKLRELGCFFALDDFGIGFSSFNYLRLLPVDYIKIDGSYIRNIDSDATQLALVQAIHNVARALGKKTIAEFVENENILRVIREIGINCAQGYYLGKPSPEPVMLAIS